MAKIVECNFYKHKKRGIPKLYFYIYRNVLNTAEEKSIVDSKTIMFAIDKVIRRSPSFMLRDIMEEMESFNMIKKIAENNYLIIKNDGLKEDIKKLKPHIFPIDLN